MGKGDGLRRAGKGEGHVGKGDGLRKAGKGKGHMGEGDGLKRAGKGEEAAGRTRRQREVRETCREKGAGKEGQK
eukprot:scaffold154754_cov15-Tisochrysis_lutea.AAC.1